MTQFATPQEAVKSLGVKEPLDLSASVAVAKDARSQANNQEAVATTAKKLEETYERVAAGQELVQGFLGKQNQTLKDIREGAVDSSAQ